MVTKLATNLNGITIAYVMGIVNAAFACALAFGVRLTDVQIASVGGLINAALILAVHVGHRVGEATINGASHAQALAGVAAYTTPEAPAEAPAVTGG